jgi:putative hydroxymethylpyrimidine transport system substrate-binding protein
MSPKSFWISGLALAAVLLAGCGGGGGAETAATHSQAPEQMRKLKVALDGWEGPETAGILMAKENGYFADAGLEVESSVPATPNRSLKDVLDGSDDLGIVPEPQVVMAKAKGAPIVIVGSLIPHPTLAMIWLKRSHIKGIADLKGKTIAIPGLPFQRKFLEAALARAGLGPGDVKIKSVGYGLVRALVSGRADATFGGTWNLEGAELKARGLGPVITRTQDLGIPTYDELEVIARTDQLSENPRSARDFLSAVARGTGAAVENVESLLDALARAAEANPETGRNARLLQGNATYRLLSQGMYVGPRHAELLVNWMYEQGMIRRKVPVAALLTNAYR